MQPHRSNIRYLALSEPLPHSQEAWVGPKAAFQKGEVRRLLEEAPGFTAVLKGADLTFTLVNAAFYALVGRRELLGRSVAEALHDLQDHCLFRIFNEVCSTGEPVIRRGEPLVLQREIGRPVECRYIDFVCQSIRGDDGAVTGVFLQGFDVTGAKKAEEHLRTALRGGRAAAWERDLNSNEVTWSENATEILGISSGPFAEFASRIHPDDQATHRVALKALLDEGVPYRIEVRFTRPDGRTIWVEHRGQTHTSLDGRARIAGITSDITERKLVELQAREQSAFLETTLDSMDQGLLVVDEEQTVQLWNRRAVQLLDIPEELLLTHPKLAEVKQYQAANGEFAAAGSGELERVRLESFETDPKIYERTRPNGTVLEIRTAPTHSGGMVRTYSDVTARRHAEQELRENATRLRRELEAAFAVQRSLIPNDGCIGGLTHCGLLRPCSTVGGDTFNIIHRRDETVAFFLVDVCGHGPAAALASVTAHHLLTVCSKRADKDAAGVVEAVNREWPDELPYFTLVYGEIDPATGAGSLIQAGHPHPLLRDRSGAVQRLGSGGLPVGVDTDAIFEPVPFHLAPGCTLLVYSDGVVEAENTEAEPYGEDQLTRLLEQKGRCARDLTQAIADGVRHWSGRNLADDVSALAIQAEPEA